MTAALGSSGISAGALLVLAAGVSVVVAIVALGCFLGAEPARRRSWVRPRPLWAAPGLADGRDGAGRMSQSLMAAAVLAVGLAGAVFVTFVFGKLTQVAAIVSLDRPVDRFVDVHRIAGVSRLMLTGTLLGSYTVVYTIAIAGGLLLGAIQRRWLPLFFLVAAIPVEILLQRLMKVMVHGTEPSKQVAIGPPGGFFSGGSARTLIVCGLLAYFCTSLGLERRQRALLWTLVALATFVEGYSRWYLGRHYAVDVVGGWMFGALEVACFVLTAEALQPAAAPDVVMSTQPAVGGGVPQAWWRSRRAAHVAVLVAVVLVGSGVVVAKASPSRSATGVTVTTRSSPTRSKRPSGSAEPSGPLVPRSGALFGASVQPLSGFGATGEEAAVTQLQQELGRRLAIDQLYVKWAAPLPLTMARWDIEQGSLPMITWAGANTRQIAAGDYDQQIRARADQLKALGQPVMLRWFAEMDGTNNRANAVSPASFVAAWRHIHDLFAAVGARNVVWVWCPNAAAFATGWAQQFYPGRAYVDWACADGYNWAPQLPHATWTSFGAIFSAFYSWGALSGKPLLIGEFGALEGTPGEKAAWIAQAAHELKVDFPAIRAVVYFDSDDEGFDWRVTTSPSALAAFRAFATEPYFDARPSRDSAGSSA
jgi:membrane-associated phospholipid phosphatase